MGDINLCTEQETKETDMPERVFLPELFRKNGIMMDIKPLDPKVSVSLAGTFDMNRETSSCMIREGFILSKEDQPTYSKKHFSGWIHTGKDYSGTAGHLKIIYSKDDRDIYWITKYDEIWKKSKDHVLIDHIAEYYLNPEVPVIQAQRFSTLRTELFQFLPDARLKEFLYMNMSLHHLDPEYLFTNEPYLEIYSKKDEEDFIFEKKERFLKYLTLFHSKLDSVQHLHKNKARGFLSYLELQNYNLYIPLYKYEPDKNGKYHIYMIAQQDTVTYSVFLEYIFNSDEYVLFRKHIHQNMEMKDIVRSRIQIKG